MATEILLRHPQTGLTKKGFVGFSWTTLFWGAFPPLFRGDFITFIGGIVILIILGVLTVGIGPFVAMFVWAFFYNGYYTRKLIERGYRLADSPERNALAQQKLGISAPMPLSA